jgi:hypothetical protein
VVPSSGGGSLRWCCDGCAFHWSCCQHLRHRAAVAAVHYNLQPMPSSTQTFPTTPRSSSEGISFSLDASLFSLDCSMYVCVEYDGRLVSLANFPSPHFSMCGSANLRANAHSVFETRMLCCTLILYSQV